MNAARGQAMAAGKDQAEGLRRLFTLGDTRIVAVTGFTRGAGVSTLAAHLAMALARAGQRVVVLDEHGGVRRSCGGVEVRPAPAAARGADLGALCPGGVIVVDAAPRAAGGLSALARLAQDVVVVMEPTAASITATYAGLKQLQYAHALQTFKFVVNKAGGAEQAARVTANVLTASGRYLAISLAPLGWVTAHPGLAAAQPADGAVAGEFDRIAAALQPPGGELRAAVASRPAAPAHA